MLAGVTLSSLMEEHLLPSTPKWFLNRLRQLLEKGIQSCLGIVWQLHWTSCCLGFSGGRLSAPIRVNQGEEAECRSFAFVTCSQCDTLLLLSFSSYSKWITKSTGKGRRLQLGGSTRRQGGLGMVVRAAHGSTAAACVLGHFHRQKPSPLPLHMSWC